MEKTINWHRFVQDIDEINFNAENLSEIQINDPHFCIARTGDKIFGCAAQCPHAAAPLAKGYVNVQRQMVCPLHSYKFNLENGRNISGEGYFLKTYPIEYRADGWYIGIY